MPLSRRLRPARLHRPPWALQEDGLQRAASGDSLRRGAVVAGTLDRFERSEINGSWISEYTLKGQLVWTAHVPVVYPSDPQQLGPDLYLVADYAKPGAFIYANRAGQVLYRYFESSGPGMLNHPSLAKRLPSGVIMINDDYANRMVAIDPKTGALVWQYGVTDAAGTAPGSLIPRMDLTSWHQMAVVPRIR